MKYSEFAIEQLKEKLLELSMKNSTPKKYAWPMFEAYEVIRQLQKEKPLQSGNSSKGQIKLDN